MTASIVLFTRDLRVHDNPALHAACAETDTGVPLFVVDDAIRRSDFFRPNRAAFLAESLDDLDERLRRRGAGLVIREGDVAREVSRLADEVDATSVHMAADYSRFAGARERRLREALGRRPLRTHHSHVVVPPGELAPSGGTDHFAVFTAYHRRWERAGTRAVLPAPERMSLPPGLTAGHTPTATGLATGATSPDRARGGETRAREKAKAWYDGAVTGYGGDDDGHNDLAADATSRLSPYLHFGCVSATELVARPDKRRSGVQPFLRQLAWRDFYHQVLAARPEVADCDYRSRNDRWRHDPNVLNWQWVAGTGTDTRPNRVLNPTLQQQRYDPNHPWRVNQVRAWSDRHRPCVFPGRRAGEPLLVADPSRPLAGSDARTP